jgi:multidrug efflux pump subunit AcrA (membrane-fusion protein)
VTASDLGGAQGEEWSDWFPAYGLWAPLTCGANRLVGAMLMARDSRWSEADQRLVAELAGGYAHALAAFHGGRRRLLSGAWSRRGVVKLAALVAAVAALWLPFPLSALAPSEVVALDPTIVRAPLDGVIDHFDVQPNALVAVDQPLLELDPRSIENKLEVASKALAVSVSEYRQAAQSALFDDKSRSQLTVLSGKMDQRRADVAYAKSLLDRIHVTASRSGIAVFDDPNDWIGRPVTIGERLLEIADPSQVELEIWLPVADAITLKPGADVEFFLNTSPERPLRATLRLASYEATPSPANLLGYRLKARLDPAAQVPRIGLRGTAKVYGEKVSLFYYLARRPLASARQLLGF